QQIAQFSQSIPENVPNSSRELITCSVNYADGSTLPCPRKETQNESVQFNLSATNRAVTGNAQTFLQASDLNGDGRVNVIDFVLLQNQRNVSGAKKYDIILDGVINAQDFAVVTERFGQITQ
ncbi:MAG: dockerin type I domain-containing protein, partial [Microgenomates group bacterium]